MGKSIMAEYAIYKEENLVFIGNYHECSKYLKCSKDSFRCRYTRFKRGITKNPKMKIFEIDDLEE